MFQKSRHQTGFLSIYGPSVRSQYVGVSTFHLSAWPMPTFAQHPFQQEQTLDLLRQLAAAPQRYESRLFERLYTLLHLSPLDGCTDRWRCITPIELVEDCVDNLTMVLEAMQTRHGHSFRVHLRVLFLPTSVRMDQHVRGTWHRIKARTRPLDWISLEPSTLINNEPKILYDDLSVIRQISYHFKTCLLRLDRQRYIDLLVALRTQPAQQLATYGKVSWSGPRLIVESPFDVEVVGPQDTRRADPARLPECNNLSCVHTCSLVHTTCECKGVRYCSTDCQRDHWPVHRVSCVRK